MGERDSMDERSDNCPLYDLGGALLMSSSEKTAFSSKHHSTHFFFYKNHVFSARLDDS